MALCGSKAATPCAKARFFTSGINKNAVIFAIALSVFAGTTSCGPMNGSNPGNTESPNGVGGTANQLDSPLTVGLSQKHGYVVEENLLNGDGDNLATPPGGKGATGKYDIRVAHADFTALAKDATVTISYVHVKSSGNSTYTISYSMNPDGTYHIEFPLTGHGNWEIHTAVTESGATDEHVLAFAN